MKNPLLQMKNHFRPLYWTARFALLNSHWLKAHTVQSKLRGRVEEAECSICRSAEIFKIEFFIEHQVDKYYCKHCQHIFSHKLNHNVERAADLFAFDKPSDQYEGQKQLQIELIRKSGVARGRFLDFGVGGNRGIAQELRAVSAA